MPFRIFCIACGFLLVTNVSISGCSAQSESSDDAAIAPSTENSDNKQPLYQVGPWSPAPFNIEEPYINIIYASDARWTSKNFDVPELYATGHLDSKIGLPSSLPDGETLTSRVFFSSPPKTDLITHWDGEWVLDWQTADGNCNAGIKLLYFPEKSITRTRKCRIEFTRDAQRKITPYHMAIQVHKLSSPLVSLRMYRAVNEDALQAGKIYNPAFLKAVSGYDIIRTMDMQKANRATIRSVDQLASSQAAHWGNVEWKSPKKIEQPFLGPPLKSVFALGVESGAALWVHAPITLGSPIGIFDMAIYDENAGQWLNNITDAITAEQKNIFESDEWENYAEKFVSALIDSGYPQDRALYVTVSNEVWNYAGQYNFTTRYAGALGNSLGGGTRTGYGAAMARLKLALDASLQKAGRTQNLIYVMEGQAGNVGTTRSALAGAKAYFESQNESWTSHAEAFGVSVASYWGANPTHLKRDGVEPNDLQALEQWFLEGPANSISTLSWNLKQWRAHRVAAQKFGVKFIGAYEGGSHFEKPREMTEEHYLAFLWGEPGGRINSAVNEALAKEFPGTILSNYGLAGPLGGQPWFEGPLGAENPYNQSWGPNKSN
ncbi:hypothetical protein [Hyphococcus sp.]|uniref:hypothetical protein n=1 Tax=Hyphococcus sp. TaxID=2038636 RepID=UPI003CCC2168